MRIKFDTLLEVQDYYGSSDFQIEARYDKFDGEEYIMFRFGYWNELYYEDKFYAIFSKLGYKVEKQEIEDEDTGWNYSYHIKNITL
jgi:hypothetical protein